MRRGSYGDSDLADWARRIGDQGWNEAYVFVKHEDGQPRGPDSAEAMAKALSYSTT
jgi:hypothetical protein